MPYDSTHATRTKPACAMVLGTSTGGLSTGGLWRKLEILGLKFRAPSIAPSVN